MHVLLAEMLNNDDGDSGHSCFISHFNGCVNSVLPIGWLFWIRYSFLYLERKYPLFLDFKEFELEVALELCQIHFLGIHWDDRFFFLVFSFFFIWLVDDALIDFPTSNHLWTPGIRSVSLKNFFLKMYSLLAFVCRLEL